MSLPYEKSQLTWNEEHTRNSEGRYCYCGQDVGFDVETDVFVKCKICNMVYHGECLLNRPTLLIYGDMFLEFSCADCNGIEIYHRLSMSWVQVTQLILYHLSVVRFIEKRKMQKDYILEKKDAFFSVKDDLRAFLDSNWKHIMGDKTRSATWRNTISGVLSTNAKIFESGTELLGQSGYWALKDMSPPKLDDSSHMIENSLPLAYKPLKIKDSTPLRNKQKENLPPKIIKQATQQPKKKQELIKFNTVTLPKTNFKSSIKEDNNIAIQVPNVNKKVRLDKAEGFSSSESSNDEEYFPKDSKTKLSNNKDREFMENYEINSVQQQPNFYFGFEEEVEDHKDTNIYDKLGYSKRLRGIRDDFESNSTISESNATNQEKSNRTFNIASNEVDKQNNNSALNSEEEFEQDDEPYQELKEDFLDFLKPNLNFNKDIKLISAQAEWELFQKLHTCSLPLPTHAYRLKRKLALMRTKRALGLKEFNLDAKIFKYINSGVQTVIDDVEETNDIEKAKIKKPIFNHLDENKSEEILTPKQLKRKLKDFKISSTPYANSFASRLYGNLPNGDAPVRISPYNSVILKRFLRRVYWIPKNKVPIGIKLLEEIKFRNGRTQKLKKDAQAEREYEATDKEELVLLEKPIDFSYLEEWHLPQLHHLLTTLFWDGIDLSEHIHAPEYTCVALIGYRVIGCGFTLPNGYLTYLCVHPHFQHCSIASFILYHLSQINRHQSNDLTLHVSAGNPALLLYQKFTFKPERFIVGFYKKFYKGKESEKELNALFCRLRM